METIKIGIFTLTPEGVLSYEGGKPVELTPKQNGLLTYLYRHKNQFVAKEDVLLALWGEIDFFKGRSADVHITRLCKLLLADPTLKIERIGGKGWRLVVPEETTV